MKTTGTERGQVSIPVQLRREMRLEPGRTILWEKVSESECRLTVLADEVVTPDPMAALGFAQRHGLEVRTTAQWMKDLREGEED